MMYGFVEKITVVVCVFVSSVFGSRRTIKSLVQSSALSAIRLSCVAKAHDRHARAVITSTRQVCQGVEWSADRRGDRSTKFH